LGSIGGFLLRWLHNGAPPAGHDYAAERANGEQEITQAIQQT
jgi:hypothetical protein